MKKVTFKGGIHPLEWMHAGKSATEAIPIRDFVPGMVRISMDSHLGSPSPPCVAKGDRVKIGQLIGEAEGSRGLAIHATVSGEVISVEPSQQLSEGPSMCVTIQSDHKGEWTPLSGLGDVESAPADQIIPAVHAAGVVGLSGASFPTHAKLSSSKGKVDVVLLNGAECETFLTSDDRLMQESPERVVDGLRAAMRALDVDQGVIAIEDNKPAAIAAIQKAAQGRQGVSVVVMETKYPQGGKKQMIKAVLGREVPVRGRPIDAKVVIINVGSAAAIADAVIEGRPLVSRITTVTGAVQKPGNFRMPIGSILSEVIAECGGYAGDVGRIVFGGSMNGVAVPDESISTTTATNGILVLTKQQFRDHAQAQCIRCGFCVEVCPAFLQPFRLMDLVDNDELDKADKEYLNECIVCNACSYICPAKRWIGATIQTGKDQLWRRNNP